MYTIGVETEIPAWQPVVRLVVEARDGGDRFRRLTLVRHSAVTAGARSGQSRVSAGSHFRHGL